MSKWTETEFTRRLDIPYPIIQGPMGRGASTPLLVATVSNAGGLGSYGANDLGPADILKIVQPIEEIATALAGHGALFHVDAAQTFGKFSNLFKMCVST